MPHIDLNLVGNGDGCWPDLVDKEIIHEDQLGEAIELAGLSAGMGSGKPSVSMRINLPDGRVVIAQTSLALFLTCADGLKAKFGDPRD